MGGRAFVEMSGNGRVIMVLDVIIVTLKPSDQAVFGLSDILYAASFASN